MKQLTFLTTFLAVLLFTAPSFAKDKAKYSAHIVDQKGKRSVIVDVRIRAAGGLFGGGSGSKEIEVHKDGGNIKIKVPLKKIKKIKVLDPQGNQVTIEIESIKGKKLRGTIASNLEIFGQDEEEFGEARIRFREAKEIELKKGSGS